MELGKSRNKPGGAIEYGFSRRMLNDFIGEKKDRKILEKLTNKRVLTIDGKVITVYHKTKKDRN
jgi:hypothetical protein